MNYKSSLSILTAAFLVMHTAYAAKGGVVGNSAPSSASASNSKDDDRDEKLIKGSVPINGTPQAEFPKLAKISSSQAVSAATAKITGSVASVSLENEDGFLVYTVEIISPKLGKHEILVDAGDGRVLTVQKRSKHFHEEEQEEQEEQDEDDG